MQRMKSLVHFQRRLAEIEDEFNEAGRKLREIEKELDEPDCESDWSSVKWKLELFSAELKLVREKAAFYLKVARECDLALFMGEVLSELAERAPDLLEAIIKEIDARWSEHEADGNRGRTTGVRLFANEEGQIDEGQFKN